MMEMRDENGRTRDQEEFESDNAALGKFVDSLPSEYRESYYRARTGPEEPLSTLLDGKMLFRWEEKDAGEYLRMLSIHYYKYLEAYTRPMLDSYRQRSIPDSVLMKSFGEVTMEMFFPDRERLMRDKPMFWFRKWLHLYFNTKFASEAYRRKFKLRTFVVAHVCSRLRDKLRYQAPMVALDVENDDGDSLLDNMPAPDGDHSVLEPDSLDALDERASEYLEKWAWKLAEKDASYKLGPGELKNANRSTLVEQRLDKSVISAIATNEYKDYCVEAYGKKSPQWLAYYLYEHSGKELRYIDIAKRLDTPLGTIGNWIADGRKCYDEFVWWIFMNLNQNMQQADDDMNALFGRLPQARLGGGVPIRRK